MQRRRVDRTGVPFQTSRSRTGPSLRALEAAHHGRRLSWRRAVLPVRENHWFGGANVV